MILRTLILTLALGSSLTPALFAGTSRGDRLIGESGGISSISGTVVLPTTLGFGDFYALMPPDNADTVAAGDPVQFPETGPTSGGIARASISSFILPAVGTYLVQFQVSVTEAGQLELSLNGLPIDSSVVGRATGTSQIVGSIPCDYDKRQ